MTSPKQNIIPITAETPPVFPCWLWDSTNYAFISPRWVHSEAFAVKDHARDWLYSRAFTHWHPDQPSAPTERPTQLPPASDASQSNADSHRQAVYEKTGPEADMGSAPVAISTPLPVGQEAHEARAGDSMIAWLERMVALYGQMDGPQMGNDREKFKHYASAYSTALKAAKRFESHFPALPAAQDGQELASKLSNVTANLVHADNKIVELQEYIRSHIVQQPAQADAAKRVADKLCERFEIEYYKEGGAAHAEYGGSWVRATSSELAALITSELSRVSPPRPARTDSERAQAQGDADFRQAVEELLAKEAGDSDTDPVEVLVRLLNHHSETRASLTSALEAIRVKDRQLDQICKWVNEGRGVVEFGITENGQIGVWLYGHDIAAGIGNTVTEAIDGAALAAHPPTKGTTDTERLDWLEKTKEPQTYEDAPHDNVWHIVSEKEDIRSAIDAALHSSGKDAEQGKEGGTT